MGQPCWQYAILVMNCPRRAVLCSTVSLANAPVISPTSASASEETLLNDVRPVSRMVSASVNLPIAVAMKEMRKATTA
jgi:hypothetical protein